MARYPVLLIILAFVAALAGVLAGRMLFLPQPPIENRFHAMIHRELDLDAGQKARIEALEERFAAERQGYEQEMRDDNRRLAAAVQAEKGYGPKVGDAVDRSHQAMGMLQKATLRHLFAMRAVLHPEQARRFDQAMVDALTAPQQ
ncbi:Spy/CpxP family protein refolding chaperone [Sphingomonas sp. SRS2]|uniref:Spy/CpxP family protein refolding chaperone n=1 Tax=Sphingomonas sp. SRS2 TaxID=133190 RepID=UPI0006184754|nr:periplasmic heavy metal sensor [Sphingomonas sp. SRS2]KKC24775.1 heavy metal resistance protein [Sphingomonas sp. SRS2]